MLPRELIYSFRNLLRAPAFAITAILTLALGIGASTAVFTVLDSVIFKPLSYRESGQLVIIWEKIKFLATTATPYTGANPRHEAFWADRAKAFNGMCLLAVGTRGVSIGVDHPQLVGSIRAQSNFLNILGVTPAMGRSFVPTDDVAGHDKIAIITYSLWQNLFHGDPKVIGRTLHIAGAPYQIVGVLPEGFQFPKRSVLSSFPSKQTTATAPPVEILLPVAINPTRDYGWNSDYGNWLVLARLKPGVSVSQAEAEMNILQKAIVDLMPADERDRGPDTLLAFVQPMQDAMVGSSRRNLWTLMAAVIGLMLIACVNLANAQLGRAVSREREAAVRSALGAGKWHLIWSSLSESLLLSLIGGAAGVLLAFDALALFRAYAPVELPRMNEIQPNFSAMAFAIATLIGSALLFGVMPALTFGRTGPQTALQQTTARAQGSRRSRHLRLTLIGVQVFGCTVLLLVT
ncbi:MAG: ABC transporter permease, partial [Acidobacteriaceae bacterium]|nr:ABC transporter permease [Acidobacteriaceae bacterium]